MIRCNLNHRLLSAVSLLITAAFFNACVPYRKSNFHGPATITDSGFSSEYRYHFGFFPSLSLRKAGTETYQFRGMPKEPMTISLSVEPFAFNDYSKIASLKTMLSVDLRDDRGAVLCSGEGRLSEASRGGPERHAGGYSNNDHWILAAGGHDAEFWRPSCRGVKFDRSHSYVLSVAVSQVDPSTPEISITPSIDSGGN